MFRAIHFLASAACILLGGPALAEDRGVTTAARVAAMNGCLNVTERGQSIDELFDDEELEFMKSASRVHGDSAQAWAFKSSTGRIEIVQKNDPARTCSVLVFDVAPDEIANDLEAFITGDGAPFELLQTEQKDVLRTKHFGWEQGKTDIGATLTYQTGSTKTDAKDAALNLIFSFYLTRIDN